MKKRSTNIKKIKIKIHMLRSVVYSTQIIEQKKKCVPGNPSLTLTPSWFRLPYLSNPPTVFEREDKVLRCNYSALPRNDEKIILNHRNAKK